jgi:diguanylate cyclase (GGDEF)-like protein
MLENEYTEHRWNELLRVTRSWRLEWNVEQLLSRVSKEAIELLGLERGIVYLLERKGLIGHAIYPPLSGLEAERVLPYSQQIAQQVIQSGRPLFAHELGDAEDTGSEHGKTIRAVFCVPLTAGRGILGALYVDSGQAQKGLTQKDQEFLEMLGLQAAAALEHAILYQSAITDPLTGLYSHRHFQQEVEQSVRRALRSEQPVTLLLMDLDHFKKLNDSFGHEVGNQCLTSVAALLRGSLRTTDVIARFGGDEFEVLLPGTTAESAQTVAEKIRRSVGDLKLPSQVTATIGLASFPENALDALSLFLRTDEALYKAKAAGRNQVVRSSAKETSLPPPSQLRGNSPLDVSFPSPRSLSPIAKAAVVQPAAETTLTPAAALEAPVTEQIDGHTVLARLGTGSTGEVLLVRQPDLNRHVALKRPLTAHLTPEQAEAFEREAKVTAGLEHPGVVTVHMMGRDLDGRRYYTMKPLHGSSLAHVLDSRRKGDLEMLRRFTLHRLLEILQRVSETIAYAHQQQVLHLDLSPSNIVVGQFGEVTIIDWGTGSESATRKRSSEDTKDPAKLAFLVGSPAYLAPELLPGRREQPTPCSDVFALGAILYEILAGRPPFLKATTRETLDALMKREVTPPETAAADAGIDLVLSKLCLQALSFDPAARPSALQFSERLGQYVRRETVWETTRFGKEAHPVVESEWVTAVGKWELGDGEWISRGGGDCLLFWKVPVPGAFRFVAEGWLEGVGELALCGRGPVIDTAYKNRQQRLKFEGYCFEFGAEYDTCTKLARNGIDVMAEQGLAPEAGRRYRLELEYDDGWLRCFIDGKRIFTYRELFPAPGIHIGFYAYGNGAHLRPLEVHRETGGVQVPAIWVADELFRHRSYEAALPRYQEFAVQHAGRLQGDEARLKMGLCLQATNRPEEARQVFESLRGSTLEPFALAEMATIDLEDGSGNAPRGLQTFKEMLQRFPESPARFRINEVSQDNRHHGSHWKFETMKEDMELCLELDRLARQTNERPVQTQIVCQASVTQCQFSLGRWREALTEIHVFIKKLQPRQIDTHSFRNYLMAVSLANGEVCHMVDLHELLRFYTHNVHWPRGMVVHAIALRDGPQAALGQISEFEKNFPNFVGVSLCGLLAALVDSEKEKAAAWVESRILKLNLTHNQSILQVASAIVDAQMDAALEDFLASGQDFHRADDGQTKAILCARLALERGQLERAAGILEKRQPPGPRYYCYDGLIHQILLSTLGLLKFPSREELESYYKRVLAGTQRDLAEMFLGLKEPRPGELWPAPLWRPEWRLWLALWLEARGDHKAAREVAAPAIDKRYGLANSQPALQALMERTAGVNT